MKFYIAPCLVIFSTFAAVLLQGCGGGGPVTGDLDVGVPPAPPPPAPAVTKTKAKPKKAVCQCGQSYGCSGGQSWCSQMEKVCGKCKKNCEPECQWSCESPKCSQTCGPKCKAPSCSVRCKGFNTKMCRMECGKPNCRVVCPKEKHLCAAKDCAKCKTECSKPVCQVACKKGIGDEQPCRNVCSQPVCHWDCKKPTSCPKPKCSMKCDKPQDCMADSLTLGVTPPMEPGETEVATVDVPVGPSPGPAPAASFLQGLSSASQQSTMRVNITSMGEDGSLHTSEVHLALTQFDAKESLGTSWVKELREEFGKEVEMVASCNEGRYQCQGDADWCAEHKELICTNNDSLFSHRRSSTQNHLQP